MKQENKGATKVEKAAKAVPLVERKKFEDVVGRLLGASPLRRSEAKTGMPKSAERVIPGTPKE